MGLKYRSIITVILLSIFTAGIYFFYWVYQTQEAIRHETKDAQLRSGWMVLLFSLISCGIYFIFWMYKTAVRVNELMDRKGMNPPDDVALLVLLGFFTTPIVYAAILQSKINMMVK